jgi:UDP-glucose 4-epimerase
MAIIAVSGSTGFIGAHLVKKLLATGHDVIPINRATGHDVADFETLRNVRPFDIAIHLAARMFVPDAFKNPLSFYNTNVLGTLNMLELCRGFNARMIFPGSYVYGQPEYLPIDEKHPVKAFNPYAQSKLVGEQLCEAYHRDFDVPVIVLRIFNPYGPGQSDNFLIPKLIMQVKTGNIHLDDPRPKRDFIFIDDIVEAFERAASYRESGLEVFNIGSGISYSVAELAKMVVGEFNPAAKVEFSGKVRKNEVMDTVADHTKAGIDLNWTPKILLEEGLSILKTHIGRHG